MTDGLSNSWISDIHQDKQGFIWVATQYGLNRFDGTKFKYYTSNPNDTSSLSTNWVLSIVEDRDGTLWLGTYGSGLHHYDPHSKTFSRLFYNYENPGESRLQSIHTILVDSSDNFWISTYNDEVLYFNTTMHILTVLDGLKDLSLNDLAEGGYNVWLGTTDGIYVYNKKSKSIKKADYAETYVRSMSKRENSLLVGGANNLLKYNLNSNEDITYVDTLVHNIEVVDIKIQDDVVWGATDLGLLSYSLQDKRARMIVYDETNPFGLMEGRLISLEFDREGNLWIGGEKGLCVMYYDHDKFESYVYHPKIKDHQGVRSINSTEKNIWIGADDGLWKYSKFNQETAPKQVLESPIRHVMVSSEGYIYAGAYFGNGLYRVDDEEY